MKIGVKEDSSTNEQKRGLLDQSFIYHVLNFLNVSTTFPETSLLFTGKSHPIFISVFTI